MKEQTQKKRQTNLGRIKEKNKGKLGNYSKKALLVYACYVILKDME